MSLVSPSHDRHWKVGELARATGLTVRALHHYDDVGLLVPSERTDAGHRLYAEQDVRRLYRILALRRLGLSLAEIAAVLDDESVSLLETVRRHLGQVERDLEHQHTLRDRLREILKVLERSVEPPAEEFIEALEAMTVIETSVEDVLIRLGGDQTQEPPPRLARESHRVVLLREQSGERVLPIWIGAQEGDAIVFQRSGGTSPRPLGPDLTARLLEAGGVRVERVVIGSLHENVYYASVTVTGAGGSDEVDARPSDALNLALRLEAPVLVAADLIDEKSIVSDPRLRSRLSEAEANARGAEAEGQWRSLSPNLIQSLYPWERPAMFEHFTEPARRVVTSAHEEAKALGHGDIGSEHLLLGLVREQESLARGVLESLGITLERVRAEVVRRVGAGEEAISHQTPFTPRVKTVLERALEEALSLSHGDIAPEHILLALVSEKNGAAARLLAALDAHPDRIRDLVIAELRGR